MVSSDSLRVITILLGALVVTLLILCCIIGTWKDNNDLFSYVCAGLVILYGGIYWHRSMFSTDEWKERDQRNKWKEEDRKLGKYN
jgi:hypothetical protein